MRILIADDDFVSRTLMIRLLEKMGYQVEFYDNGAKALKRMREEDAPEMAILDWLMPDMDGPDVIRSLRSETEKYPYLILLTNRHETSDKVKGLESGADDYLVKPVNPAELNARVHVGIRFLDLQKRLAEKSKALLQLERQQKTSSLNQMAGGVAHHLNNKLQAVIGGIDLMLMEHSRQNAPDFDTIHMLRQIRTAAEEASMIGKKMLIYLSQNRGLLEVLDLVAVCREVIDGLRSEYPVLSDMQPHCTQTPFRVQANPAEIHEVILQVLKNALEADPRHPPHVSLELVDAKTCVKIPPGTPHVISYDSLPESKTYIKLTIEDKGPGIPAENISQIFDPFITTKFTGRGMGLPVCLGIVKKLGGGIRISSPPEGGGTKAVLCLPAHET